MVLALRDEMESYDGWITWNGLIFDLPFIDGRLALNNQDPLERRFARGLDMMYHAYKAKFHGVSLEHVALSFGYRGCRLATSETTRLGAWREVSTGLKGEHEYYDAVLKHNDGCIDMTEFCYKKLKPWIVTISKR